MSSHPTNYNSHGRPLRQSPTSDSHSGQSYSDQGRTTLPPLTIAFPTSDPPGLSLNFTSTTYPNLAFPSPDTVHNNYLYPYPTQQRSTTPASSQQHYCTWPWPLVNAASTSSNSHAKTRLPSSKRRPLTLILRTRRIPSSQDTMAVRRMALITELRRPLVQPTLGGTRLHLRPWMSREKGGRVRRDRSITRLRLTCRRNTHRMTCARRMRYIPLRRTTHRINPSINPSLPLRTRQGIIEGLLPQLQRPVSSITSISPCR
jgi:hypothetical protein